MQHIVICVFQEQGSVTVFAISQGMFSMPNSEACSGFSEQRQGESLSSGAVEGLVEGGHGLRRLTRLAQLPVGKEAGRGQDRDAREHADCNAGLLAAAQAVGAASC